ncbi:hypothetical protein BN7_2487 [Wickerhamomyces ciferrii]|uniref:Uncharacterized protein n=1 Tax=Wickerhamomyces ciferrii (strain ATCC 14091 / BCRC 22168 / CBS 111 / JCM 3599 / NBRC 0793 / NRRL Y-1031 F-60-10) TaxID=1206466 RepID=K0KIY9_WICCF|nr:uncharacterized protein BN7_2487 [Wickerhamomyces ciferrii]CCH42941.1 hypothetical protein BN7_2487 [Wickerhamomyces ciferrii]
MYKRLEEMSEERIPEADSSDNDSDMSEEQDEKDVLELLKNYGEGKLNNGRLFGELFEGLDPCTIQKQIEKHPILMTINILPNINNDDIRRDDEDEYEGDDEMDLTEAENDKEEQEEQANVERVEENKDHLKQLFEGYGEGEVADTGLFERIYEFCMKPRILKQIARNPLIKALDVLPEFSNGGSRREDEEDEDYDDEE